MDLEKQLELIFGWFQHEFDNHAQYQLEKKLQKSTGIEPHHNWAFTIFRAANIPKVGSHVLLCKQGLRPSGSIVRKRMFSFRINYEAGHVEHHVYKLNDESIVEKFENDPSIVFGLDPTTDAEKIDGCCITWEYLAEKNRFHGTTGEKPFRFQSKYFPGKTILASSDIFLGPDHLWTLDRGIDLEGNKMYGFKTDEHHKALHLSQYKGTITIGVQNKQNVTLHNQGSEVKVKDTVFTAKLAQFIEPDSNALVLKLSVYKEGETEAVGMVVCDSHSTVIGGVFTGGMFSGGIDIHLVLDKH